MADRDGCSHAEQVAALEAWTPWDRPAFRADLALLADSVAAAARVYAADARVIARLAGQVPRCAGDERGASPWTSFRQEIAVARRVSGQAAAVEIGRALRLTSVLPQTLDLLEAGRLTVPRARVFLDELESLDDELAGQLDADLADRVVLLAPWRIRQEVRRAALALDPDVAAVRTAAATAQRRAAFAAGQDGQGWVTLTGPAVPLVRWYTSLDVRARALRAAGDPRSLEALRFDVATSTFPCRSHVPLDPAQLTAALGTPTVQELAEHAPQLFPAPAHPAPTGPAAGLGCAGAVAGLRVSGVEAASSDCRMSRPVQAVIVVPVETACGLSNEPAWLDGYGWVDAPSSRQLLVDAELRRMCIDGRTGQAVDLADRDVRPPPDPGGVRQALVDMLTGQSLLSDTVWQTEPAHDPSPRLREFTALRDRTCDGPTQSQTVAARCDDDHDLPFPDGPTAAWNLASRARRTHQLKHYGWTPVRTGTSTIWTSPAGQVVEVPNHNRPAPGIDPDPTGRPATLPDPDQLAATDTEQLTPVAEHHPWLPADQRHPHTDWTTIDGSDDPPPF